MKRGGGEPFTIIFTTENGVRWKGQGATCSHCGKADLIRDNTRGNMPPQVAAKMFREKGWRIAGRRSKDLCPTCAAPKTKTAKRPPEPVTIITPTKDETPMAQAEAPRQPTPADRLKIVDELSAGYDPARGLYLGAGSDQWFADKLKVPRAWVADLRELLMGGPDKNEVADTKRAREIEKLDGDLQALKERAANLESEASGIVLEMRALEARLIALA